MIRIFLSVAVLAAFGAGMASAGQVEMACLKTSRQASSRALCGCIQDVANLTLTQREQSRVAAILIDPHKARGLDRSASRAGANFWQRYKSFGDDAALYCSRG